MRGNIFSDPRGVITIDNGQQIGVDTTVYTTDEILRHAQLLTGYMLQVMLSKLNGMNSLCI